MSTTSRWARPAQHASPGVQTDHPRVHEADRARLGAIQPAPRATIDSVKVIWQVARTALSGVAPLGASRMLLLGVRVESLADATPRVSIEVCDPASGQRSGLHDRIATHGEVIADIRGQVHIEIPGWLHATVGPGADGTGWRLVYARTPVLDQLGVPGGRAEPVGVAVTER
jgi:hypothetical protein